MSDKVQVAILEDHQSVIDGYLFRLGQSPEIEVVAIASFWEDFKPMLVDHLPDVLILDVGVSTAPDNPNPFPILEAIPKLLEKHPKLSILSLDL